MTGGGGGQLLGLFQHGQAVAFAVHAEVGDDDVELLLPEVLACLVEGVGDGAGVPLAGQGLAHDLGVVLFVVDDEDSGGWIGHGERGAHGTACHPCGVTLARLSPASSAQASPAR